MIWLVKGMRSSYKSIADFRKDHVRQLREVNRDFVVLCRELSLFGGEEVAVDGSLFSADASRGSIKTGAYVDNALKEIERKIEEYQRDLEEADAADEQKHKQDVGNDEVLREKIEELKRRQEEGLWSANSLKRGEEACRFNIMTPDRRCRTESGRSSTSSFRKNRCITDSRFIL